MTIEPLATLAPLYTRFAQREAAGKSPRYEALALAVAHDPTVLAFLSTLPTGKRQPNLIFAAARKLSGAVPDIASLRQLVSSAPERLRDIVITHATQTNEPARCATLLPVLAQLPQPLALIEIGASAGLCLFPDQYAYDYGRTQLHPAATTQTPIFACRANAATPLPTALPRIVWRAGLDLNPLDVTDAAQRAWLQTLVWPEQHTRLANLTTAMAIAARARPRIVQGDLLSDDLDRLCRQAPPGATRVIFHTAVLAYVPAPDSRHAFSRRVRTLCDAWIANESADVFPDIARQCHTTGSGFLLSLNGQPKAWTDPHGASLDWLAA